MRVFSLLRNVQFDLNKYTTTYSSLKSGLCGAPFVSYFPKVSYNLVELCKDAPCLCTNMLWDVHQYDNRKSTKTYGFHFFDKNDLFLLWAIYLRINVFLLLEMRKFKTLCFQNGAGNLYRDLFLGHLQPGREKHCFYFRVWWRHGETTAKNWVRVFHASWYWQYW